MFFFLFWYKRQGLIINFFAHSWLFSQLQEDDVAQKKIVNRDGQAEAVNQVKLSVPFESLFPWFHNFLTNQIVLSVSDQSQDGQAPIQVSPLGPASLS